MIFPLAPRRSAHKRGRNPRRIAGLLVETLERRDVPAVFGSLLEFTAPTANSSPWDVAYGPDGNLWFTESAANQIGQFNPVTGVFQEFPIPTTNSQPYGIASGADATGQRILYFAENQGGKLGQITVDGAISEGPVVDGNNQPVAGTQLVDVAVTSPDFARVTQSNSPVVTAFDLLPTPPANEIPQPNAAQPQSSAAGSDNWGVAFDRQSRLYFAEQAAGKIAVFAVDENTGLGVTTEYPLASGSQPTMMTQGPDGNIWFTEFGADKIGMFNVTTHAIQEYALPAGSGPWGIASSPSGVLYFTTRTSGTIGRITVDGQILQDTLPDPSCAPQGVTVDPEGNPWFVETATGRLAKYDLQLLPHAVPTASSGLNAITVGPDNNLWFTENLGNNLGRLNPTTGAIDEFAYNPAMPNNPSSPVAIVAGPDGNFWVTADDTRELDNIPVAALIVKVGTDGSTIASYNTAYNAGSLGYSEGVTLPYIISGPDGKLWYNDFSYQLGSFSESMTTAGAAAFRDGLAFYTALTVGPDGGVWTTQGSNNPSLLIESFAPQLIDLDPAGGITHTFPIATTLTGALVQFPGIVTGPDGNLWITDVSGAIIRMTTSGVQATFPLPAGAVPNRIVVGSDGDLWATDMANPVLYRITTAGVITSYAFPAGSGGLGDLVAGPDGNLWVLAPGANRVYQFLIKPDSPPSDTLSSYIGATYRRLTGAPISPERLSTLRALVPGASTSTAISTRSQADRGGQVSDPIPGPAARARIARAIISSREYREKVALDTYVGTLRRAPTAAEQARAVRFLQRGGSPLGLQATLIGSRQYYNTSGGENTGFLRAMTRTLLHRAPTPRELQQGGRALDRQESRRSLASSLARRPEALRVEIDRTYRHILGRPPGPIELHREARRISAGGRIDALVLRLGFSDEFLSRTR